MIKRKPMEDRLFYDDGKGFESRKIRDFKTRWRNEGKKGELLLSFPPLKSKKGKFPPFFIHINLEFPAIYRFCSYWRETFPSFSKNKKYYTSNIHNKNGKCF